MLNVAVEEIARACASSALILMIQELGTLPIQLFGTDELKQRFLPRCASGEWSPAFALSEPEAGSDPGGMITRAVRDGDEWVINGTKNWITNLGVADFYIVFAKTDPLGRPLARDQRLRRRGRPRRLQRRQARAQARDQGLADRPADLRRRPRAGRQPDRRGRSRDAGRARHARPLAARRRRAGRRHRPGRDRPRGRLRPRAAPVRPADRRVPGHPVQARRHGDAHRRRARAALPRLREDRPRRAGRRQVLGDGQAVRLRHRDGGDRRGGAGARRLRLRHRVSRSSATCATRRSRRSTRARTRSSGWSSPAACDRTD